MLEFYLCTAEFYYNNKLIVTRLNGELLTNEKLQDEEYDITWDNIIDTLHKLQIMGGYNIWRKKKGIKFELWTHNYTYYCIKQWKEPELNIKIKITYTKINKSISSVLKWSDGEKALQYLVERGLTVIREKE